jgi:hypothetical protein
VNSKALKCFFAKVSVTDRKIFEGEHKIVVVVDCRVLEEQKAMRIIDGGFRRGAGGPQPKLLVGRDHMDFSDSDNIR